MTEENQIKQSTEESDLAKLQTIKKVKIQSFSEVQAKEVTLHPLSFKYFNGAIKIINKYYSSYRKADAEFLAQKQYILETIRDQQERIEKLEFLKENFDDIGIMIEDIVSSEQSTLYEDISNFITYCLRDKEIDFDEYDFGQILILLAAAIELNLDFFTQSMNRIPLFKKIDKIPNSPQKNN